MAIESDNYIAFFDVMKRRKLKTQIYQIEEIHQTVEKLGKLIQIIH